MVDDNDLKPGDAGKESGTLKGIYSTKEKATLGVGMTSRVTHRKRYWAVWEPEPGDDAYLVQSLNQNLIPTGAKRRVTSMEFKERFRLEPDFFVDVNAENVRHLWELQKKEPAKTEAEPDRGAEDNRRTIFDREDRRRPPRKEEPPRKVEPEEPPRRKEREEPARKQRFEEPLLEDIGEPAPQPLTRDQMRAIEAERNARAGFGLGMSHLKRGNMDKAQELLRRVAVEEGDYVPEHKHMFNEFGVGLRKNQMLDLALLHMRRALSLAPSDEHIYHNMARLYYEKGDKDMARKHLEKSLQINPDFKESRQFLDYLDKHLGRRKKKLRFKI